MEIGKILKVYVFTAKSSKLEKVLTLALDNQGRKDIVDTFKKNLQVNLLQHSEINELTQSSIVVDLPYYVNYENIDEKSYLWTFKQKVDSVKNMAVEPIKLSRTTGDVKNLEKDAVIKFIAVEFDNSMVFLQVPNNSNVKNKTLLSFDIGKNTQKISKMDKGLFIPEQVTALFCKKTKKLYVYDVNRFESMLFLNENAKQKSEEILRKFMSGEYKIGNEKYKVKGLDDPLIKQRLFDSKRALRRLANYESEIQQNYEISKIKDAVEHLNPDMKLEFDDVNKEVTVTPATIRTFVGILHNIIVERLITGEVEITI